MIEIVRWILGFSVSAIWMALNFFLTLNLLRIATLQKSGMKPSLILLIKFPVLYLAGFIILICGFFPIVSLLAGMGFALLVIGVIKLWPKRT